VYFNPLNCAGATHECDRQTDEQTVQQQVPHFILLCRTAKTDAETCIKTAHSRERNVVLRSIVAYRSESIH